MIKSNTKELENLEETIFMVNDADTILELEHLVKLNTKEKSELEQKLRDLNQKRIEQGKIICRIEDDE